MAFVIAFVVPCGLWLVSRKRCVDLLTEFDDLGGDKVKALQRGSCNSGPISESDEKMLRTQYHSMVSFEPVMYGTIAIGAVLFLYVFVENIRGN